MAGYRFFKDVNIVDPLEVDDGSGEVLVRSTDMKIRKSSGTGATVTAADVTYTNPDYPTVQAALDQLLYVAPDITGFVNNINIVEKGQTITSVFLNWALNKPMTSLSLNNGIGSIPADSNSYTHSGQSITSNRTYTLTAGDGTGTDSASTSIQFQDKRYWGTSPNATLDSAGILGLGSSEFATTRQTTKTINGGGQYIHILTPVSQGLPSFKVNGLDNNAFTITTVSFTNASGFTSNYYDSRTNTVQFGSLQIQIL